MNEQYKKVYLNYLEDNLLGNELQVWLNHVIIDDKPIVIKGVGALFITDYSRTGVIYKWGDRFTFLQQLSVTIKAWGYVITIIALLLFIISMKR